MLINIERREKLKLSSVILNQSYFTILYLILKSSNNLLGVLGGGQLIHIDDHKIFPEMNLILDGYMDTHYIQIFIKKKAAVLREKYD